MEKNPTFTEVKTYLINENGWTEEEVNQLAGYYFRNINEDDSTTLSRDEWTRLASQF